MAIALLMIGLAVVGFGVTQHLKGMKILAAPFRKTGELAREPDSDEKGLIATEGEVVPPSKSLLSPVSKTPCLYYEVVLTRKWEKVELTANSAKTTQGVSNVDTIKGGAEFGLDDGSGVVAVDASRGGDFDNLKKQGDLAGVTMTDGQIKFGQLKIPRPIHVGEDYTLGYDSVEKLVPVGGSFFVVGKLIKGKLTPPGWRAMKFFSKGREELIAASSKKKKIAFIGGGIAVVASIPLMLIVPKPLAAVDTRCHSQLVGLQSNCTDNTATAGGQTYEWKVEKAATYSVQMIPAAPASVPTNAAITITNVRGDIVGKAAGPVAGGISVDQPFEPGKYAINMNAASGKGGYDYVMRIAALEDKGAEAADPLAVEAPKAAAPVPEPPATIAAPPPKKVAAAKPGKATKHKKK